VRIAREFAGRFLSLAGAILGGTHVVDVAR
jgi:hypothetical protein